MPLLRCSGTRRGGEQEVDARLTPDSKFCIALRKQNASPALIGHGSRRLRRTATLGRNSSSSRRRTRYSYGTSICGCISCATSGSTVNTRGRARILAGGLVQPSVERYIKSTLAWYTSADMIPGRWPVKVLRLPDRAVDGRSYFAIEEFPEGGNPSTLLVDKITYESAGVSSVPGRYLKCTQRPNIASICTHEDVISGGKVVGSIDIAAVPMHPDDSQFEMPEMLEDWTTAWLQRGYARALGAHVSNTQTLRGEMRQVINGTPTVFSTQWRLDITRPNAFAISQTYGGREVWHMAFDGKSGASVRMGQSTPAPYLAPTVGMALNHCELHSADCGVRVTRLANVGLGGRWYFALGVTSLRDPAQWYTVLLNPDSGLPYALWLQEEVIYLDDYVTSASGDVISSKWTTQTTATTFEVEHVNEIAP